MPLPSERQVHRSILAIVRVCLERSEDRQAQAGERQNDRDAGQHRNHDQDQVIFSPFAGHECPFPPGRGHDNTGAQSPEAANG